MSDDTKQVTFRLSTDLLDRLSRYAELLSQRTPGLKASRVDALRILVERALALDEDAPKPKTTKAKKSSKK
jgi:hypothetical protein